MNFEDILQFPIEDNEFNLKLKELYSTAFSNDIINFIESYNSDPQTNPYTIISNPQLVTISKSFVDSQCRIIHFGDETNGWGGQDPIRKGSFNPKLIPEFLMKLYEAYKSDHKGDRNWTYCDKIKILFPQVGIIHMNILLMGYPRGCTGGYPEVNYRVKEITRGILDLASPQLCIFHTGGKKQFEEYDNHIKYMISKFETIDELRADDNTLLASKIKFIDPRYQFQAIRTHHLNNRIFSSKQKKDIENYIEKTIELLIGI